jgi:diketogulonate reductase-like aldo/keto reductase
MAYTPLGQGRLRGNRGLVEVASRHAASPAQIALPWLLRQDGMMVIPKQPAPTTSAIISARLR